MNRKLRSHALALEAQFFRKDMDLKIQRQKLDQLKTTRDEMARISGISDTTVLDKLIELEISLSTLASLSLVPLIEVAWADGSVDQKEKEIILATANDSGFVRGSIDYELLEKWLQKKPEENLLVAWDHYVSSLCATMNGDERAALKHDLLSKAKTVAEAHGGFLGITSKISKEEKAILKRMEMDFCK